MSDKGYNVLSDIVVYSKYAKYLKNEKRRETWDEIIDRNINMHILKYPHIKNEIIEAYKLVYEKKILPSMRSLQFAGQAMAVNEARMYNCSFLHVDSIYSFSETFFLLLSGSGVGISVQKHHVAKLPSIKHPNKRGRKFVIADDIAGWADAIKVLMKSYTGITSSSIEFDYSQIREKGMALITSGGKAPGFQPLKIALEKTRGILDSVKDGDNLTTFQAHRIMCIIADSVLAGGIRRSSIISLFSHDDLDMMGCKTGAWYELYPELGRANNSVVLKRDEVDYEQFKAIFKRVEAGNTGEPGISWTNDLEYGFNPLTTFYKIKCPI